MNNEKFYREIFSMTNLFHDNIIRIYAHWIEKMGQEYLNILKQIE